MLLLDKTIKVPSALLIDTSIFFFQSYYNVIQTGMWSFSGFLPYKNDVGCEYCLSSFRYIQIRLLRSRTWLLRFLCYICRTYFIAKWSRLTGTLKGLLRLHTYLLQCSRYLCLYMSDGIQYWNYENIYC